MLEQNAIKVSTKRKNLYLRVLKGHFATSNSHSNYYIDVSMQKSRLSEAQAVASELVNYYETNTIVDTILCLDGMEVVGTCLANELTKGGYASINAHQTIYVITPEQTAGSQLIFRDNLVSTVKGKNVLIIHMIKFTVYLSALNPLSFTSTVDPWTTWVWTAWIHLYRDFFF